MLTMVSDQFTFVISVNKLTNFQGSNRFLETDSLRHSVTSVDSGVPDWINQKE